MSDPNHFQQDGHLYRYRGDDFWEPVKVDYSLDVTVHFKDAKIDVQLRKATEVLSRWIFDTREQAVRDALIKLGWTPPPEL